MMSRVCMMIMASIFFINAEAQVDPGKVDKQVKDPATSERGAKADRHVSKDRNVYDSSVIAPKAEKKKRRGRKG
jgi:hypothetical protein